MPLLGELAAKGLQIIRPEGERRGLLASDSTRAGVRVTTEGSLQAIAVYTSTSLIATTIGALPVKFIERGDRSREPRRPEQVRALWSAWPNPDQDIVSFYESMELSILLWGNFYGACAYNRRGDLVECWPMHPERLRSIERLPDAGLRFVFSADGKSPEATLENRPGRRPEVLFIRGLTIPGRIAGVSPIRQAMETVGLSLSAEEHAARFLGDGVHLSGLLTSKAVKTPNDAKDLLDSFNLMNQGPKRAGRVGVVGGDTTFNSIGIPPAELQFLEQMKYSDRKIASMYRVPPHMVGDVERSTSWGSGIQEQSIGFVTYTLGSPIRKIEASVDHSLLRGTNLEMKFNVNGLLRGAVRDRALYYRQMREIGVLSANDIRELEDMPPLPEGQGGDDYLTPLNMASADEREAGIAADEAELEAEELAARVDFAANAANGR